MHLKRLKAPRLWKIQRKTKYWAVRPRPGPHPLDRSVPLLFVVRDMLNYANTAKEAKRMIKQRKVLVDQRVRTDPKFPVGLMDAISFPELKKHFRVLIKKHIMLVPISAKEAKLKPCKIQKKKVIKGGKIQLGLHDGRTLLAKKYQVGDTLLLNLPDQSIEEYIKLRPGNYGLVIGGKLAGEHGKITEVNELVTLKNEHRTVKKYVMAVGKQKPLIKL